MEIPDFQSIMLPLLEFASDKIEHSTNDTIISLAKKFNLSDDDLKKMLPSENQKKEKEAKDVVLSSHSGDNENSLTPEENIEYYYQDIRKTLAQDLLSK